MNRGSLCCGGVVGWLVPSSGRVSSVTYVSVVSLDFCADGKSTYLYCARRIPAYHRCTQCSILLHSIEICFLSCIFGGRYSKPIRFGVVVGSGLVSTSPAFMRSSVSHPAGKSGPHFLGWEVSTSRLGCVV